LVPVLFHESFEGRENENLTDELLTELPGILNWAIEGWRRLREIVESFFYQWPPSIGSERTSQKHREI
jgi:phage/plasmid-associated DNA primase